MKALQYNIQEIQKNLLLIIKDFDAFCKKHNITYYLMGGTALGAMRHKGFIPWDDDIDVFLTFENYQKFLHVFSKENPNPEKYFLQKGNTDNWPVYISQICVNNTTYISDQWANNKKKHHGLFIDIMCLYAAPANKYKRKLQYSAAMLLKINALHRTKYPAKGVKKIMLLLSSLVVNRLSRDILYRYVCKYENENVDFVGHFFGRARFKYTSFPKSFLGTPRYVDFEDTKLPVMEFVEKYLTVRFGEKWHEMPDQKTLDQYPNHGNFVDLNNHYSKYL